MCGGDGRQVIVIATTKRRLQDKLLISGSPPSAAFSIALQNDSQSLHQNRPICSNCPQKEQTESSSFPLHPPMAWPVASAVQSTGRPSVRPSFSANQSFRRCLRVAPFNQARQLSAEWSVQRPSNRRTEADDRRTEADKRPRSEADDRACVRRDVTASV